MKTLLSCCILMLSMNIVPHLSAQTLEEAGWPRQHEAVILYAGSNGIATTVNLTFDHLFRQEKVHIGYSAGINYLWIDGVRDSDPGDYFIGPHATLNLMTGKGANHFEGKLGASFPIIQFGEAKSSTRFIPLLTLGYRSQLPNKMGIFRIGITTFMPGIGGGTVIGQQW